jgi:hypothetical protein
VNDFSSDMQTEGRKVNILKYYIPFSGVRGDMRSTPRSYTKVTTLYYVTFGI